MCVCVALLSAPKNLQAALACDVEGVAERIVLLKSHYPGADVLQMVLPNPRLLLQPADQISADAAKVTALLGRAPGGPAARDAIVQAVPELSNPVNLARYAIASQLRAPFP